MCNIWSEETAASGSYILDSSANSLTHPLPGLPANYCGLMHTKPEYHVHFLYLWNIGGLLKKLDCPHWQPGKYDKREMAATWGQIMLEGKILNKILFFVLRVRYKYGHIKRLLTQRW